MTRWPESPPDPPEECPRCGSPNLSDHALVDDDEEGPHYACVLLGEAEREPEPDFEPGPRPVAVGPEYDEEEPF